MTAAEAPAGSRAELVRAAVDAALLRERRRWGWDASIVIEAGPSDVVALAAGEDYDEMPHRPGLALYRGHRVVRTDDYDAGLWLVVSVRAQWSSLVLRHVRVPVEGLA
jgi:hypothetical protein